MQAQPQTKRRVRWWYLVIALVAFTVFVVLGSLHSYASSNALAGVASPAATIGSAVAFVSGLVSIVRFVWDVVIAIRHRTKAAEPTRPIRPA